jgi:hypothetical protein
MGSSLRDNGLITKSPRAHSREEAIAKSMEEGLDFQSALDRYNLGQEGHEATPPQPPKVHYGNYSYTNKPVGLTQLTFKSPEHEKRVIDSLKSKNPLYVPRKYDNFVESATSRAPSGEDVGGSNTKKWMRALLG